MLKQIFVSGLNTDKIASDALTPIQDLIDAISQIKKIGDIWPVVAQMHRDQLATPFFKITALSDTTNSSWVSAHLSSGGLGLSGDDLLDLYHIVEAESDKHERHNMLYKRQLGKQSSWSSQIRAQYLKYVSALLSLSGHDSTVASIQANNIVQFESKMALLTEMPNLQRRQKSQKFNYKFKIVDLKPHVPNIDFQEFFQELGFTNLTDFIIQSPSYVSKLSELLAVTDVNIVKSYLKFHLLMGSAPFLSEPFVNENFDFFIRTVKGIQRQSPRHLRVVRKIALVLQDPIAQHYVNKHFSPEKKKVAEELVQSILVVFKTALENTLWMQPATKKNALSKLSKLSVKIGYPNSWADFSSLETQISSTASYLTNIRIAGASSYKINIIDKVNKQVDKSKWTSMAPFDVNAYYNFKLNEMVFPAVLYDFNIKAKLQPPFFFPPTNETPLGEPAMNFGAIGSVIGHEIIHGYDITGRQFDGDGELADWWTAEDSHSFTVRANMLQSQFNNHPFVGSRVNGQTTLGENIADLGGVAISFAAFQQWMANHNEYQPVKESFTPNQQFFLAYAQNRVQLIREEEAKLRLKSDVHSPAIWRVDGILNNIPEFYQAFDIHPNDSMYIEESKRVSIWSLAPINLPSKAMSKNAAGIGLPQNSASFSLIISIVILLY
jgi:putative endopeptidase